jgi:hypothetical protein
MYFNIINVGRFIKRQVANRHYFDQSKTILRGGLLTGAFIFGLFYFLFNTRLFILYDMES